MRGMPSGRLRVRGQRRRRLRAAHRAGIVTLALMMLPMLMGAGSADGQAPMPTAAGIRNAIVRLADWVTGRTPPPPVLPRQATGKAPGAQHQVPAAVTRAVAQARGRAPGKGPGQLPAYVTPAAKVKRHVTGTANRGGADSFRSGSSKVVPSGATATSTLYRNADGSYTRLEYPVPAKSATSAARSTLTFSGPSGAGVKGVGVKGTRVTSASLRVLEAWAGQCPTSATVNFTAPSGHLVGQWTGKPPASACGSGSAGGWISVPVSVAGLRTLNSQSGAALTVTVTPAPVPVPVPVPASSASQSPSATPSAASTATPSASATPSVTGTPSATGPTTTGASPAVSASPSASPSPAGPPAASPGTAPAGGTASTSLASRAMLVVTAATDTPPQIDDQWPANGYNSPSLTPELIASGSDPDGDPVGYDFTVYKADGTVIADSDWQWPNDVVIPAGTLAWGQTYYWSVLAGDGTLASSGPQIFALRTPVPQPLVYSGMAQDGSGPGGDSQVASGPGFDQQNGNFTTDATDVAVPVVGPPLSLQRTYNSLNPLSTGAFGTGWTSVLDMQVRPGPTGAGGSAPSEIVTYPDGEQVDFGLNADGITYTPPQGRFGTLAAMTGGFELVDKTDAIYKFTRSLGSGVYAITELNDVMGHALHLNYSASGQVTQMNSAASHRVLNLTWSTPTGAQHPHVATVSTDPATVGVPSTAITWQYNYSGDQLTSACNQSQAGQPCTSYAYQSGTDYPAAALNSGPQSYWRLNEGSGSTAASSVLANEGADNATYVNVTHNAAPSTLGGAPASVGTAGFNGTSAYIQVPASLADEGAYMSVSLTFKSSATGRVLLSESAAPVTSGTTAGAYLPVLYIGSDGKLLGGFSASGAPMSSTWSVNDGNWHNVVLTASGNQQVMYIDGAQAATKSGQVSPNIAPYIYLGAGFLGNSYPDQPHAGASPAVASYFSGTMSDVATWARPLTAAEVAALYTAGTGAAALLTSITRPSGKNFEQASYDPATSAVTHVTDANGGSWTVHAPTMSGSSQVYVAAVRGADPMDYWRLADTGTSTAVNQFNAGTATYSNVTQGVSGGPFSDVTIDGFNGTSSYLALPDGMIGAGNQSVSMWFKTTATTDGVLFSTSVDSVSNATTANGFAPNLYIGDDGKLNGEFTYGDAPIESSAPVNDGAWHNVVLSAGSDNQTLYLDGKPLGSVSALIGGGYTDGEDHAFVGAGFLGWEWTDQSHFSPTDPTGYRTFFTGNIAEVAVYPQQLSAADVTAEWTAAQHSPGLSPIETATVTDPGGRTLTATYDPLNSARILSYTDGLGDTTTFGYDSLGFQGRVTNPDGDVSDTGYDVRGNVTSTTTCQDQSAGKCSTAYYSYSPDDTAATLSPPYSANDQVKTSSDPRSSSADDTTYRTTDTIDPTTGELLSTTTPPVPGYPSGRTTTYQYTDGTSTTGSSDGSIAPGGLLWKTTSPGGAVTETLYDIDGNVGETINADHLTTDYSYDKIGRKTSQTVSYSDNTGPHDLTTTYAYDADGRVTQQVNPPVTDRVTGAVHTAQVTTAYDADGDVLSQVATDTTGGDASRTASQTWNAHDQKATSTDAAGAVTHYTYDSYGNLASKTDPAGNETDYAYDPDGRLLTTTLASYTGSPAGSQPAAPLAEETRVYDPAGRLASVTDAMGRITSYAYTDNGLTARITRTGPGGGPYKLEQDTYDAAGNVTTKVTNNGATTTAYDVDAAGRVASQTVDPGGLDRMTVYNYDADDHVTEQDVVSLSGSGSVLQSAFYTYDPMGNKTSQALDDPGAGGPSGWWKLNQTSGTTVTDTSGTGNLGTASGVTWSGGVATLSGADGHQITTRGPVVDTTGSFTVTAWVNMAAHTGSNEIAVSQDANALSGFYLGYSSDTGTWQFVRPEQDINDAPVWPTADSGVSAHTGTLTFLAGVYDANTGDMQVYVNGTAGGTDHDPSPIPANGPLEIGGGKWDGQAGTIGFDGSISDVQVYPNALTSDEIGFLNSQRNSGGDLSRDGLTTTWNLDQRGLPTSETNPDGITTQYDYDAAGRLAVTTGPPVAAQANGNPPAEARAATYTGYDTFGDVTESQDPDGNTTNYAFDADGRPVSQVLPSYTTPAGTPVNGTSTKQYNSLGQLTTATDPLGNITHYAYDQLGNRTTQTDPDLGVTTTAYDADGEQLSQTGPTGARTTATYDFLGRQVTSTDVERSPSAAYTTTTSYTPATGDLSGTWKSSVTSPDSEVASYRYDAAGETTQVTDGAGNVTGSSYDALGRVTAISNPDGTSQTVSYDPAGNQVAQASLDASGHTLATQTTKYDGEGDQLATTDALGHATTFVYDPDGNLTAETQPVTDATGIVTAFGYDPAGHQTAYLDGLGNSWFTSYNTWNLPEYQVVPATSAHSSFTDSSSFTSYNGDGRPVSVNEAGGVTMAYTYDSMGNLTGQSGSGATAATASRSFTYDTAANMLTAATTNTAATGQPSNATSETFTWNDRGLPLTAVGTAGSTTYTWNGDGQQATVNTGASLTTSYGYDSAGRLHTLSDPASGATLTYSYNPMSQVSQVSYGTSANTQAFGYDGLHRLTSDTLTHGATTLASIGYGYDADGDLTSKTTTGFAGAGSNTYGYDQANRLTSWTAGSTTTAYTYDGAGNRTKAGSVTYTYDARDELIADGTSKYLYTANGDMSTVTTNSGTVTSTSTSDAYGQQGAQGSQSNVYDALGRDVKLTVGATTTSLSYQGSTGQLTSDGTSSYTWTPDGTLTGTVTSGTGKLDLTDRHTDVVAQFTATGATLSASRTYGPWGTVTAGTLAGTLGYQSQYTSPTSGQTNMGARWYNPATGGFGNKDTVANKPVPDSASASPFGYAADNPLGATDPTGHASTPTSNNACIANIAACLQSAGLVTTAGTVAPPSAAANLATAEKKAEAAAKPKPAPAKKPSTPAATKPYDGPVTCPPNGNISVCEEQAYIASGGQLDSNGIPNGQGYVPPKLSPAQVKVQNDAAKTAQAQAAAVENSPAWDEFLLDFLFGDSASAGAFGNGNGKSGGSQPNLPPNNACPSQGPTAFECYAMNLLLEMGQPGKGNSLFESGSAQDRCVLGTLLGIGEAVTCGLGTVTASDGSGSGSGAADDGTLGDAGLGSGSPFGPLADRLLKALKDLMLQKGIADAIADGRVAATARFIKKAGAAAEGLGWQVALGQGEVGVEGPGNVSARGPDYITYDPATEDIVVYDAKYRSNGSYPKSISAAKQAKWMPYVKSAVKGYSGADADQIRAALDNGDIRWQVFAWPN
jgi:RHS repeat-associated protein